MKVIVLNEIERAQMGFSHKIIVLYTDAPAGTTAQSLQLLPATVGQYLPVGSLVRRVAFKLQTAFVSASLTACTVSIGDAASATQFIAAQSVQSGVTPITYATSTTAKAYTSATEYLRAVFTPTTANLNTLTAGQLDVYLDLVNLDDMDRPI